MIQIPQIKALYYNWRVEGYVYDNAGVGEDYDIIEVNSQIETIKEHLPQFEGDKLYYDAIKNGKMYMRIFNPNKVIYFE